MYIYRKVERESDSEITAGDILLILREIVNLNEKFCSYTKPKMKQSNLENDGSFIVFAINMNYMQA